jgi:hypothetical protein
VLQQPNQKHQAFKDGDAGGRVCLDDYVNVTVRHRAG